MQKYNTPVDTLTRHSHREEKKDKPKTRSNRPQDNMKKYYSGQFRKKNIIQHESQVIFYYKKHIKKYTLYTN